MENESSLKHRRDWESVYNNALRAGESEGMEIGIKKGMELANAEAVIKLIDKLGFDNEQAASFMAVSLNFVKKARALLEKEK